MTQTQTTSNDSDLAHHYHQILPTTTEYGAWCNRCSLELSLRKKEEEETDNYYTCVAAGKKQREGKLQTPIGPPRASVLTAKCDCCASLKEGKDGALTAN